MNVLGQIDFEPAVKSTSNHMFVSSHSSVVLTSLDLLCLVYIFLTRNSRLLQKHTLLDGSVYFKKDSECLI